MEWNATLKNLRISPRKTRLVVDAVRGKSVKDALAILDTLNQKSSIPVKKLIQSAVANAKKQDSVLEAQLQVSSIFVDAGLTLKRFRPRAFGRAYTIRKRSSHITLTLKELDIVKKRKATTEAKETSEKPAVKEAITTTTKPKTAKAKTTTVKNPAKKAVTKKALKDSDK
jgi:large subunit ribosomal protein L22